LEDIKVSYAYTFANISHINIKLNKNQVMLILLLTSDIEVKNNVLLTEIVIIGDVPESFTQFPINNR